MEKQFEEMEMLERIFYMQNLFDSDLIKNRNLEFSKEEWIQKEVLAIVSEQHIRTDARNPSWESVPNSL